MKKFYIVAAIHVFLGASAMAGVSEWVSVCQVTDNFKQATYQVVSNEEYTKLTKDLWNRNRVLTKAVRLASDEWKKSEGTKSKVFPGNITGKAQAKRLKTFPDAEKAQAYVAELEAKDAEKAEIGKPKSYLEQKIKVLEDEIERARKNSNSRGQTRFIEDRLKEIHVLEEKLSERRAKESEKEATKSEAQGLIQGHIETLVKAINAPSHETPQLIWGG